MRFTVTFLGLMFTVLTVHAAVPTPGPNQIVCEEYLGSESDGTSEEVADTHVGLYTIDLDAAGKAVSLRVERKDNEVAPAMHVTLTKEKETFLHDVIKNDPNGEDYMGVPSVERVQVTSRNGDQITIKINDHSYAGPMGSTVFFKINGKKTDSSENAMVNCKGQLQFPDEVSLQLEKTDPMGEE